MWVWKTKQENKLAMVGAGSKAIANVLFLCTVIFVRTCAWLPNKQPLALSSWIPEFSVRTSASYGPLIEPTPPIIQLNMFSEYEDDEYVDEELENDDDEEEVSDEELEATMGEWDERVPRFNTVHLTGRIGGNPEPRYFDDGKVVVNVSFATKCKYHGLERQALQMRPGEEETDWYGLEIWGQKAEFVAKYVDKGTRVGVVGQLQVDSWKEKETGLPRKRAKIIVRDIDILETKAETDLRRSSRKSNNDGTGSFF